MKKVCFILAMSLCLNAHGANVDYKIKESRLIPAAMNLIIDSEGFKKDVYIDSLGNKTIGIGFLWNKSMPKNMTFEQSKEHLKDILLKEYISIAKDYAGASWDSLNLAQKAVLIDLSYNLGSRLYSFKKARQGLFMLDFEGFKHELKDSKWCNQTKTRCKRNINLF